VQVIDRIGRLAEDGLVVRGETDSDRLLTCLSNQARNDLLGCYGTWCRVVQCM
jgi:hypothetical protein